MIAGITPSALSLRAADLPIPVRRSALSLTCFAISFVLDFEQRGNRFVVMNPFHAFSEQLGDTLHVDRKILDRTHWRAVSRYQFLNFRFLQSRNCDIDQHGVR